MKKELTKNFLLLKKLHDQLSISHLILPSHILLTLFYFYHYDSGSRYTISEILALPMTRTRKLLDILEENNLIIKNKGRKGSVLTESGLKTCQTIFTHFKIVNPDKPIDLGDIVLRKITSLIIMDKTFFSKQISTISVRDSSLKCGALGASIFETYKIERNEIKVKFYDDQVYTDDKIKSGLEKLEREISQRINLSEQNLIIASTINDLPKYYFNPLFDSKTIKPFKIVLIASAQSMWEIIEKELL